MLIIQCSRINFVEVFKNLSIILTTICKKIISIVEALCINIFRYAKKILCKNIFTIALSDCEILGLNLFLAN